MTHSFSRLFIPALFVLMGVVAGCADSALSEMDSPSTDQTARVFAEEVASAPILRNPQLLENAFSASSKHDDIAWGKGKGKGQGDVGGTTYVQPDLLAIVDFDTYEADGVTRRILDEAAVTRRVLDEYGITRRVLDEYGITRRVLEEYGITRRVLEEYGITRRVLDDYGITRRVLDEYGITEAEFDASFDEYLGDMTLRLRNDGSISVRIKGEKVTSILLEMGDDSDIEFVEPDPAAQMTSLGTSTHRNNDDQFISYGIDRIAARSASGNLGNTHVYVLDSGVNNYDDLRVATRKDFTMLFTNRDQLTWDDADYVEQDYFDPGTTGNPDDENGHGTHVAGTIGAIDNKTGTMGAAPDVTIHSLKVLTAEGQSDVTTIIAAINYVKRQKEIIHDYYGHNVLINLSLGMDIGTTQYNVLDDAVKAAADAGIVVVVSAGNDAEDASTYSPAHVAEAITVGAYDHQDRFSYKFSNFGPAVDLLAPGHEIVSLPHSRSDSKKNWRIIMTGTSMAAPHVTAAAAMYMAINPGSTPAQVQAALKANAQSGITGTPGGTTDKTVHMEFMRAASGDRALSFDPEWKDQNSYLELKGDGAKGAMVEVFNADTNAKLGEVTVHTDAKFYLNIENPSSVPCNVRAEMAGQSVTAAVAYAPIDCDDGSGAVVTSTTPVTVDKARYAKNKTLTIDGTGPAGLTHTITDQNGEVIGLPTADSLGDWKLQLRKPGSVPCSVTVTAGGQSATADVTGACGN